MFRIVGCVFCVFQEDYNKVPVIYFLNHWAANTQCVWKVLVLPPKIAFKKFQKIRIHIFYWKWSSFTSIQWGHNPQVISWLLRMRITECPLTFVSHLFGFPPSRRSSSSSYPVWVWGTRNSQGGRTHIQRVWQRVEDCDPFLGQKMLSFCHIMWRSIVIQEGKNSDLATVV